MAWYGYEWEAFNATTEDGCILTIFHIIRKTGSDFKPTRPEVPILIMHSSMMDGTSWFVLRDAFGSDNIPLPIALWRAGYDVWIGNSRGTKYSLKTEPSTPGPENASYWDYSLDVGQLDSTAFIELIKNQTGREMVNYVGYATGNMQMFYTLATDTTGYFEQNINKFIALAPCILEAIPVETTER